MSTQETGPDQAVDAQILDSVDRFIQEWVEPRAATLDVTDEYPRDLHEEAARLGLFGVAVSSEHGGVDVSLRTRLAIIERTARSSGAFAVILCTWPDALDPLNTVGSEGLKREYLPAIASGELIPAIAMSEPDAGSDFAGMKTTATRDGDHYIINGSKSWCTLGGVADLVTVFAKTDPQAGHKGISAFLVPKDIPGCEVRNENLACLRGAPQSSFQFNAMKIPSSYRLGDEGAGFKMAMEALDDARLNCSAQALGVAYRCIHEATEYAKQRIAFGQPIVEFQGIHFLLAELCTEYAAARALWLQAIDAFESGRSRQASVIGSMAKNACTAIGMKAPVEAIQIFGAMGLSTGVPLERMMRDAKAYQIFDGTTQIHNLIIGRYLQREGLPFS